MSIVAVPALGFALWLQFSFNPPLWVHLLSTLPLTVMASMALLRPLKGWLVCTNIVTRRRKDTSAEIEAFRSGGVY